MTTLIPFSVANPDWSGMWMCPVIVLSVAVLTYVATLLPAWSASRGGHRRRVGSAPGNVPEVGSDLLCGCRRIGYGTCTSAAWTRSIAAGRWWVLVRCAPV